MQHGAAQFLGAGDRQAGKGEFTASKAQMQRRIAAPPRDRPACDLLFGIQTAPRPGGENYLSTTLDALLCQFDASPPTTALRACVAVFDVRDSPSEGDAPFDVARRALASRRDVLFVRGGDGERPAPTAAASSRTTNSRLEHTRRQTRDVARALTALGPSRPVLLGMDVLRPLFERGFVIR